MFENEIRELPLGLKGLVLLRREQCCGSLDNGLGFGAEARDEKSGLVLIDAGIPEDSQIVFRDVPAMAQGRANLRIICCEAGNLDEAGSVEPRFAVARTSGYRIAITTIHDLRASAGVKIVTRCERHQLLLRRRFDHPGEPVLDPVRAGIARVLRLLGGFDIDAS